MELTTFIEFINNYSLDVLIMGVIISVLTGIVKKIVPEKIKSLIGLIPFILGILLYGLYSYFLLRLFDAFTIVTKGFQCGGIATLYYAFFKQILSSSGSVKQAVESVLKGILSTAAVKELSALISSKISLNDTSEQTELIVRQILSENAEIPKEISWAMARIITVTLSNKKK